MSSNPFKIRLQEARAAATRLIGKESNTRQCRQYTAVVDQLMRTHFRSTLRAAPNGKSLGESMALLAVGGYARRDLSPFSDIDLLFVLDGEPGEDHKEFIKNYVYPLYDIGVCVAQGVRTVGASVDVVGSDLHSATALIESRLLGGSAAIHRAVADGLRKRLRDPQAARWFCESLRAEIASRHEKHGRSIFVLEPHVKEGCGGLRDVHAAFWLAYVVFGTTDLTHLGSRGPLSAAETRALLKAEDFLLGLRNALHILEGRKCDHLTFERQVKVAQMLGYKRSEAALPEEHLMRDFFAAAQPIQRLSGRFVEAMTERIEKRAPGSRASAPQAARERPSPVAPPLMRKGACLFLDERHRTAFRRDPDLIMKTFALAAGMGLRVHEDTRDLIRASLPAMEPAFRSSPVNRSLFLGILRGPGCVYQTVRDMHECGALAAYIPEFAAVRHLPRIDFYHQYTVDEHLLRTLRFSELLLAGSSERRAGPDPRNFDHASRVASEILRWDLLNLSLLLHDIGKGEGRGHVIRGAHITERAGERMGLPPAERDLCRRLVLNHQKMSHQAFRRNLQDPRVAQELAEELEERELLRMLYVMTVCDLNAVGDTVWNDWKSKLLAELYERTLDVLAAARRPRFAHRDRQGLSAAQVLEALGPQAQDPASQKALKTFLDSMPERYAISTSPQQAATHFGLVRRLSRDELVQWKLEAAPGQIFSQLTVAASDAPGAFANICGALSSRAINILAAQIYTSVDGLIVDVFQVQDQRGQPVEDGPWLERLRAKLNRVLAGKQPPPWKDDVKSQNTRRLPDVFTPDRLAVRPATVEFNNSASAHHTVIEIKAHDFPGLLHAVTQVMSKQRLNIDLALIATEAYRVVEVFYVTDWYNNKLEDERQIEALRKELLQAIAAPGAGEGKG